MSQALANDLDYFNKNPLAIAILQTLADFTAIFLWTLALFFFSISLISVLVGVRRMSFHLVWWAFVFPNVGFTIATAKIGERLASPAIQWLAVVMTIILVITWIFVLVSHVRAVFTREIMMPGKDEDKGVLPATVYCLVADFQ